jgi:hypothetical protein
MMELDGRNKEGSSGRFASRLHKGLVRIRVLPVLIIDFERKINVDAIKRQ